MIAWSYTRLKDFERCPLIFKLKNIPNAQGKKDVPFSSSPAMEEGKRKHKILERAALTLQKDRQSTLPPSEMSHVYPILNGFTKINQIISPEMDIAFKEDLTLCSWFDKQTWLRVKVDLMGVAVNAANSGYDYQNDVVNILDWKTGKVRVDMDQLRLYNVAALLYNPEAYEARSALVFVDHKQSSKILVTKREDLTTELTEFTDRSEAIQIAVERDSWPAVKNMFCKWCPANVLQCSIK